MGLSKTGWPTFDPGVNTWAREKRRRRFALPAHSTSLLLIKHTYQIFRPRPRDTHKLQVLFDVRHATHAYQGSGDSRGRAYKLNTCLRVRGKRAQRFTNRFRQAARYLALQDRSTGDCRYPKRPGGFKHAHIFIAQFLILKEQRFGHREIGWQLNKMK